MYQELCLFIGPHCLHNHTRGPSVVPIVSPEAHNYKNSRYNVVSDARRNVWACPNMSASPFCYSPILLNVYCWSLLLSSGFYPFSAGLPIFLRSCVDFLQVCLIDLRSSSPFSPHLELYVSNWDDKWSLMALIGKQDCSSQSSRRNISDNSRYALPYINTLPRYGNVSTRKVSRESSRCTPES